MSLVVESVSKRFKEKLAVNRISFAAEKGKAFGLIGRNGAGKTTTIRMILGIIKTDERRITWGGKEMGLSTVKVGYLPEERGLYPKAKVGDQLIYLANLRGMETAGAKKALAYWLERFGISEYYGRKLETLSKGNQQKVQLVSAVIHDPELVILDEPFSGLDPVNMEVLNDAIRELSEKGKCVILSSHVMENVERFCEDILLLKNGEAVLNGSLADIKKTYGRSNAVIRTETDLPALFKGEDVAISQTGGLTYTVKLKNEAQAQRILEFLTARKVVVGKFEVLEPSLHEIFIEKAGDS